MYVCVCVRVCVCVCVCGILSSGGDSLQKGTVTLPSQSPSDFHSQCFPFTLVFLVLNYRVMCAAAN